MKLHFRWTSEELPGDRWLALYRRSWPAYRAWFLSEGDAVRPGLETCARALTAHMPELVPLWERLVELAGGDEDTARMLSLYRPAPYLAGCTQAVQPSPEPMLVRNYDYHPHACEAAVVRSRWLGTSVLASSDCLWGVLDGMNEHGLVVALSFGGSRTVGDGFGIPIILRYVLETCRSVRDAGAVLERLPSHMAYNVSLLDRSGDHAVAYMRPGTETVLVREVVSANHQLRVEWPEHAARTRSVERKRFAEDRMGGIGGAQALADLFLEPPLFVTDYERWHGTLYTALYRPERGEAWMCWPGASVVQRIDDFTERELVVPLPLRTGAGV